jgi:hypothetical protein
VIPAQAGIQEKGPLMAQLDPGLRRDDRGFLLNLVPFISVLIMFFTFKPGLITLHCQLWQATE